jgi:hypothetical protein
MSKNTDEQAVKPPPTRLQLSRYEREQRTRRVVVIGAAVVGVLTLLLTGLAVLQSQVWEPNRSVATVGGQAVSVAELQKRMRFDQAFAEQRYAELAQQVQQMAQQSSGDQSQNIMLQFYQQQLQQMGSQLVPEQIARNALDSLVTEKLVRQESTKRGIAVSAEEVQESLEKSQGFYRVTLTPFPTATPEPTATSTNTPEPTHTSTATATPTATSTNTPAPTATSTATASPTLAPSATISGTVAATATTPPTATSAPTPTQTNTPVPTATSTAAPTNTPTALPTATLSPTVPLPTSTPRQQPTSISTKDLKFKLDRLISGYTPLGFAETDVRNLVEANLYAEKLREAIGKEVKTAAPHYQFDYIRFTVITEAQKAVDELNKGTISFDALISRTNAITQPTPIGFGGNVPDWLSASNVEQQYGKEVLAQLESASLGKPTGLISATTATYVLLPKAREVRTLTESELEQAKQKAYSDWLEAARKDAAVVKEEISPDSVIPQSVRDRSLRFQQQVGQLGQ